MNAGRLLIAVGLAAWMGGLAGAAAYVGRLLRIPKSAYTGMYGGSTGCLLVIPGLILFAVAAYSAPTVALVFSLFATGLVAYVIGAYAAALTIERRRAVRLGRPEPGTAGTASFAECAVFLAIALPFAVAALGLTVDGIGNELAGNRGERRGGARSRSGRLAHSFRHGAVRKPIAHPVAPIGSPGA